MRELDAIEITTTALESGGAQTLILGHPHPDTVLLSHFEVTDLSPPSSSVELTDLRIKQLSYLIIPVPLRLIQQEQRHAQKRADQQTYTQLQRLLGLTPQRRETRWISLDIPWRPNQQLVVTFKNPGNAVADKVSIELVLYAFNSTLPAVN